MCPLPCTFSRWWKTLSISEMCVNLADYFATIECDSNQLGCEYFDVVSTCQELHALSNELFPFSRKHYLLKSGNFCASSHRLPPSQSPLVSHSNPILPLSLFVSNKTDLLLLLLLLFSVATTVRCLRHRSLSRNAPVLVFHIKIARIYGTHVHNSPKRCFR